MDIAQIQYTVGQVVYGKIKGYPPWPAVIAALKNKNVAKITYFNSGECSELSFKKLTPYHAAGKVVERYLNKNRGFSKAYHEMEIVVNSRKKTNTDEEEGKKKETEEKQTYKQPKVIIKLLSKDEILKIQRDLKKTKKKRDISGRCY